MKTRLTTLLTLLYLSAVLALTGCSSGDDNPVSPGGSGGGGETTELGKILDDAGAFEIVQSSYEESEPVEYEDTTGSEPYFCTRRTVDLTEGYSDYPQFDPNSQVIYPGNLLQGNTLDDATPSGIPVDRGPGTIVITLVNGANSASRRLDQVGLGSVYDAMNEIIADNPGDLPARTTYAMERITSREQLGVSLRAEYSNLTTDVQASFDYSSDVSYNRFLVRLTQSYYTIAFEPPTDSGDFFGPEVTASQLGRYVQPGNPAAYVSSVTYGRIFYLLIQSTDSVQEMEASLDASFNGAVAGGSIGADVTYISELSSVKIGGYAIGGEANQAAAALTGDFEALKTFIAEGGTIRTGQPLSYTVNAANDPARQLKVKVATSYDIVDCSPLGDSLPDGVFWYRASAGVSTAPILGAQGVTRWQDLVGAQTGDDSRDAVVPFGGPTMAGLYNPGNPDGGNVVSFQFNTTAFTGRMRIPGTDLRQTDYTLFAAVHRTGVAPSDNTPVYWTWGDGDTAGQVIRIGFDDNQTVSISHGGGNKVAAPLVRSIYDYQLFTFVFSQTDGMRIYINGLEKAHDPNLTIPIELFTGASIGVSDSGGSSAGVGSAAIEMLEYQVYDYVPTESQRRAVETGLMGRYNF